MNIQRVSYSYEIFEMGSCQFVFEAQGNYADYFLFVTKSDYGSMRNMAPEIKKYFCTEKQIEIGKAEAEDFLRDCEKLELQAAPHFVMGCDGASFTMTIECGFNEVTCRWWGDLPKEWRALDYIVHALTHWATRFEEEI